VFVWIKEGRLSQLFCGVLYATVVHNHKHTYISSSYSSLDWVLSHWVHFTVHSLDLFVVYLCTLCFCFSYCIYVVLLSAQWGGPSGIEAQFLGLLFLQCFDTVDWVF